MSKGLFLILASFLLGFTSCTPPPPPQLSKEMKKMVDSLYTARLDSLKEETAMECTKQFKGIYQLAIDSIQNLRAEEIQSILSQ